MVKLTSALSKLLVITAVLLTVNVAGQMRGIDSLRNELRQCNSEICRIHILTYLGDAWYVISADSALLYTELGIAHADTFKGQKDSVYFSSLTALLNNSAFLNQKKGNLYQAIMLYNRSMAVAELSKDSTQMTTTLLNLSSLYYEIEDDSTAEKLLSTFKRLLPVDDDGVAMGNALLILGKIALRRQNTEAALNHFTSAITFYNRTSNKVGVGRASILIGKVYSQQRQNVLAKEYYDTGYRYLSESWDKRALSECALLISIWHQNEANDDSALFYARMSYDIASSMEYAVGIRDGARQLAVLYEKRNQPSEALKYYHIFWEKSGQLKSQDIIRIGTREQLRADYNRKSAIEKIEREKEEALRIEKEKQQKLYMYAGIALIISLLVVVVVVFRGYRNKQKANLAITEQKKVIEERNAEIRDSIVVAKRIQQALMPSHEIWNRIFNDHFVYYVPKDVVSGDFYWSLLTEKYCFIACCDSTGHGVPGAFISLLNISFMNEAIAEKNIEEPGAVFDFVRKRLAERLIDESTKEGMDGILLRFERHNPKNIAYAASNNKPVVVRNGSAITLHADKMPVGKTFREEQSFRTFTFEAESGDTIYTYTDGFADQFGGPKGKKFKYKQLDDLLAKLNGSGEDQRSELDSTFTAWKSDQEQVDDVLIIGLSL